jgi:hypothetical protein
MAAGDIFHTELTFARKEQLDEVLRDPEIDFGCRVHVRREEGGALTVTAFLTEEKSKSLESRFDVRSKLLNNLSEQARKSPPLVGQGDRFQGGKIAPQGLGKKI